MKKTILLIIILISSIFCLNTYKKSYNAYISNGNYKTLLYKTLLVWNDNKSFNEIKRELTQNKHILKVQHSYNFQNGLESMIFRNNNISGELWIYNISQENIPKIVYGDYFPDNKNYYIICPQNFLPTLDFYKIRYSLNSDIINSNQLLNQTIPFSYYGSYDENMKREKFDIDLKVVGVYENNNQNIDEYVCKKKKKTLNKIANDIYSKEFMQSQNDSIIEVDKLENMEYVEKELKNLGYNFSPMIYLNTNKIEHINNFITLCNIILFITLFIISTIYFFKKKVTKKINTIKKDITSKILFKFIYLQLKDILGIYFLSLIFTLLIILFINVLLFFYPLLLEKIKIIYDLKNLVYIFFLLFISKLTAIFLEFINIYKKQKTL